MSHDRKRDDKEELKEVSIAKAHEQAEENAKGLQKAVAFLMYQAERDMAEKRPKEEKKDEKEDKKDVELRDFKSQRAKNNDPPIFTPLTAYGYGTPGGGEFKRLVDKLRAAVDDYVKEGKGYEAAPFKNLVDEFEGQVRDAQNGWMMGQPVEPGALKEQVKKFQKDLDNIIRREKKGEEKKSISLEDEKDLKGSEDDPAKLQKIKDQLADFPANIDRAVGDWQRKAQARVYSNESEIICRRMLAAEKKHAQVSDLKQEQGGCDILQMDEKEIDALKADKGPEFKAFKAFKEKLSKEPESTRAYALIRKEGVLDKVVYINKKTKEITEIKLDAKDAKKRDALEAKFREKLPGLYSREEGLGWRSPIKVSEDGPTPLTPYQEKWIAKIIDQKPDWKKLLPCAFGDSAEMEKRNMEERELTIETRKLFAEEFVRELTIETRKSFTREFVDELGGEDKANERAHEMAEQIAHERAHEMAAQIARDRAVKRLKESEENAREYDVGGEKFTIKRKKDDKEGGMIFSALLLGNKSGQDKNIPEAMAKMIDVMFYENPFGQNILESEPLDYAARRTAGKSAIGIEKRIAAAIEHAEELHSRGIYGDLQLDKNTQDALRLLEDEQGLIGRAQRLHAAWEKHILKSHEDQQYMASQQYTAGVESKLGELLSGSPPDDKKASVGHHDNPAAADELDKQLKSLLGAEAGNADKKFDAVKEEVQKLDKRIGKLYADSQSINDRIEALKRELEKEEIKKSPATLDKIAKELEGLEANGKAVAKALEEMKPKERAKNYGLWLAGLGDYLEIKREMDKPDEVKDEKDAKGESSPAFKEFQKQQREFQKKETYLKLLDQMKKANDKVATVGKDQASLGGEIQSLKEKITDCQTKIKQNALEAEASRPFRP